MKAIMDMGGPTGMIGPLPGDSPGIPKCLPFHAVCYLFSPKENAFFNWLHDSELLCQLYTHLLQYTQDYLFIKCTDCDWICMPPNSSQFR